MTSFIRRSKTTRESRRQALRDQQDYSFDSVDFGLRRSRSTREVGIRGPGGEGSTPPRMSRSKSNASLRNFKAPLPDIWMASPTATATTTSAQERKLKTTLLLGLTTPALSTIVPPPPPKRAPPPPPIRLSTFPPRMSSRNVTSPRATSMFSAVEEEEVKTGEGGGDFGIGIAIGTPTGMPILGGLKPIGAVTEVPISPGFRLPEEPFGSEEYVYRPPARGTADADEDGFLEKKTQELPKPASWKRLFGRGLFSKMSNVRNQETVPETKASNWARFKSPAKATPRTPRIEVDMPSVEMERYSVMFGNLLAPNEKSTIFARRRSRDMRLHFGSEEDLTGRGASTPMDNHLRSPGLRVDVLKRNATTGSHLSPHSPLFHRDDLRRASSENRKSPCSPRRTSFLTPYTPGLIRPHTTAGDGRLSPLFPPSTQDHNEFHIPELPIQQLPIQQLPTQQPPIQQLPIQQPPVQQLPVQDCAAAFRPGLADDHPSGNTRVPNFSEEISIPTPRASFEEGDDDFLTRDDSFDDEPVWEMLTPPPPPRAKEYRQAEEPSATDLEELAQISIARQISLSRRQLLIPVVPKNQRLISREALDQM